MRKFWQLISLPSTIDEDPLLEQKTEAYLAQNVKGNVLHVTEQNPLPTKDVQFFLGYIGLVSPRLSVYFETVTENGYIATCGLWENHGQMYMNRYPDHRQKWSYEDVNEEYFLASFAKLTCGTPVPSESNYEEEILAYKRRHTELDFEELVLKFDNFERLFPVLRNDNTPEPVLAYRLGAKLSYERVGHFYSNYQLYYDKIVEFYATSVTIANYALKAKKIHLGFDTYRGERDSTFVKGVLQEESFAQQVYFTAYVVVQFEFCPPPASAWDAEDAILDSL